MKRTAAYGQSQRKRPRYRRQQTRQIATYQRYRQVSPYTPELKNFDGEKTVTVPAVTGTILNDSINTVAQGTTDITRIGRKMTIKSINFKGAIRMPNNSDASACSDRIRLIIYLDKQANKNGVAVTVANLLDAAPSSTQKIDNFRNLSNTGRFQFLHDHIYDISCNAGAYDGTNPDFGENQYSFKFSKSCNIPIEFDSTAGAITEMTKNNIGVMAISMEAAAQVLYGWRIRYLDA